VNGGGRKLASKIELPAFNTRVSYMLSNITVILVGVLFYHDYMFWRLIGPSSGYSGGLHCSYSENVNRLIITV
jgi:hypothetical protein